MGQNLDDVVLADDNVVFDEDDVIQAAFTGKKFGVLAYRVTPPDEHGVSQYTINRKINIALDGERSSVVLDFLIEGELARVSLNGLYKTSVPVPASLIKEDSETGTLVLYNPFRETRASSP